MSDSTFTSFLDTSAIIAKLERDQEETRKFVAEQHKLMAEARKMNRDPWVLMAAAVVGSFATVAPHLPDILRALRGG